MAHDLKQMILTFIGPAYKLGQKFNPKGTVIVEIPDSVKELLVYKDTLFYANKRKIFFVKNNVQLYEEHISKGNAKESITSEINTKADFISLLSAVALDDTVQVNKMLENENLVNKIISELN